MDSDLTKLQIESSLKRKISVSLSIDKIKKIIKKVKSYVWHS